MSDPLVFLRLSPAQARCVNLALSYVEATDPDEFGGELNEAVLQRTRTKVHEAMAASGVEP